MIAATGIYGIVAQTVIERTREMGIRLALGAPPGDAVRLLLTDALKMAGWGMAIGAAASIVLARSMAGLLFEVRPSDPGTYALVMAVLAAVAAAACLVPARRLGRLAPVRSLRAD